MNPLYVSYLGSAFRWFIGLAVGWAVKHGADASAANGLAAAANPESIAAFVAGAVTLGWSWWQKHRANTALAVAAATGTSNAVPTKAVSTALAATVTQNPVPPLKTP